MKKSTIVKGALAVAGIGVGILCAPAGAAILAYMGVSAAATTGGAVLLGGGGAILGLIGGGIIGKIIALPGSIFFGKKLKKAVEKHGTDLLKNDNAFNTAGFPKTNFKVTFGNAGQTTTQKAAPSVSAPKNALRFVR